MIITRQVKSQWYHKTAGLTPKTTVANFADNIFIQLFCLTLLFLLIFVLHQFWLYFLFYYQSVSSNRSVFDWPNHGANETSLLTALTQECKYSFHRTFTVHSLVHTREACCLHTSCLQVYESWRVLLECPVSLVLTHPLQDVVASPLNYETPFDYCWRNKCLCALLHIFYMY